MPNRTFAYGSKIPFILLVDADDTIENLLPTWIDELNKLVTKKTGKESHVRCEDVTEWDISKFFPDLTREEVFSVLTSPGFWSKVTPKPDAQSVLQRLYNRGLQIFVCTNSHYETIAEKYECVIKRYFPFIDWDHVIVCREKQMINATFLVDDAPHNLFGGNYRKILFSAPHNSWCDAGASGFTRVDNWEQIYDIVDKFITHQAG